MVEYMELKTLMQSNLLKECQLLTKSEGSNNVISSAMILETPIDENRFYENQLVVATFHDIQSLSKKALKHFFQSMKEQGVSALVVKLNSSLNDLPNYLIEQSDYWYIPLIQAPQNISYERLLFAIYKPILKKQEHLLRTYYEVRQEFTKVERNLRSFEQVLETLYRLIQTSCSLNLPTLEVNIHCGDSFSDYEVVDRNFLETSEFTKNTYERVVLFSPEKNKNRYALETQIHSPFANNGVLRVYIEDETHLQSDLMILENAVDLVHEQIQIVYLLKKHRYTRMNNLADTILQSPPEKADELENLLDEANINSYPYFQGIAFNCKPSLSQKNKAVLKKIRQLRNLTIYFDHHKCTVVLFNLKSKKENVTSEEIKQIFHEINVDLEQYQFAISQVKSKSGLKEILFDCLDGLRFNNTFSIGPIVSFDNLGVFQIFMRDDGPKQMMEAIPENLLNLWLENDELFETLFVFFKNNRNYKKTSEELFVHPKTVHYRINKLSEILALDFSNSIELVNYELATYFLHMKKENSFI